jgi:hypothetical protein
MRIREIREARGFGTCRRSDLECHSTESIRENTAGTLGIHLEIQYLELPFQYSYNYTIIDYIGRQYRQNGQNNNGGYNASAINR